MTEPPESLLCPDCGHYPDTPEHEYSCLKPPSRNAGVLIVPDELEDDVITALLSRPIQARVDSSNLLELRVPHDPGRMRHASDVESSYRVASESADRFRDVLCQALDLETNPGDDELIRLLLEKTGHAGEPESHDWREFVGRAEALARAITEG